MNEVLPIAAKNVSLPLLNDDDHRALVI